MRLVSRSCTWLVNDYAISVQINGPPTGDGSDEWLSSTFVEYTSPHTGRSTKLLDNSFGSATFASVDRAREAAAKFLVENGFSDPLRFDSVHFRTERWVDETAVGVGHSVYQRPGPKWLWYAYAPGVKLHGTATGWEAAVEASRKAVRIAAETSARIR